MAIAKMQKFNIITFNEYQDSLMEQLQDFQNVELFPAEYFYEDTSPVFSKMSDHPQEGEIEEQITEVRWTRKFLENYIPKLGMIEGLRQPIQRYTVRQLAEHAHTYDWKSTCESIRAIDKRLRTIEQERRELSTQEDELNIWRYFDEKPSILENFEHSVGMLGTIPASELTHFTQELGLLPTTYQEVIHQTNSTAYLLVMFHKENQRKVRELLTTVGFEEYHYPFESNPSEDLQEVKERIENFAHEEDELRTELKSKKEDYQALGLIAEYLEGLQLRIQSNQYLLSSNYALSLSGWVPVNESKQLIKSIEVATGKEYFLEFQEVKEEEIKEVPILLKNSKLVKPFENLVEMYSLPQYNELDPTPFMMPFYAMAFGMMVADFGYGLLMFLAIIIGKKIFHFKKGMESNLNFFAICAVPTMFWGLLYGNAFGYELPFQVLSTTEDITQILAISVIFGYLQILFALGMKVFILWKMHDEKLKAVLQGGSWIIFLLSLIPIVLGMTLFKEGPMMTIGIVGLIAGLVLVVIGGSLDGNTIAGKFGTGLYSLLDVTNYLGDLISYTRLMALGVAGGSIATAFNMIIGFLPIPVRFTLGIVLFAALHGLNMFLSYLSAYVHGIRLQYLEFFGKFYEGGGHAFKPFKTKEKFVEVISEKNKKQGEIK